MVSACAVAVNTVAASRTASVIRPATREPYRVVSLDKGVLLQRLSRELVLRRLLRTVETFEPGRWEPRRGSHRLSVHCEERARFGSSLLTV